MTKLSKETYVRATQKLHEAANLLSDTKSLLKANGCVVLPVRIGKVIRELADVWEVLNARREG